MGRARIYDSLEDKNQLQAPELPAVEKTMLGVVSQLTGYPVEMLGLDMDIEADLGIDSIKKVEILSTLEETIPNLPQISPEIIGSLKTLGQISEYLSGNSLDHPTNQTQTAQTPEQNKNTEIKSKPNTRIETKEIETILLKVVCQLTGYPTEMLGLDMDIEADLGIDSIKKVEILSTLEENIPSLPQVSPEIIGSLKTLGQIVEYLSTNTHTKSALKPSDIAGEAEPVSASDEPIETKNSSNTDSKELSRKIISIIKEPIQKYQHVSLPKGKKVFVTDDKSGLSKRNCR